MDFNAAMETFAEAWVAANTQTVVNTGESQSPRPPAAEGLPTMLTKDPAAAAAAAAAGRLPSSTSSNNPQKQGQRSLLQKKTLPAAESTAESSSSSTGAKSIPIHCIVEQTGKKQCKATAPGGGATTTTAPTTTTSLLEPVVELDTYAILPATTLFSEIVRTALVKIGYTASEAMGAKGAVQIKNWKPLTFDTITENPNATVESILGDLTSIATIRIRLCSQSKLVAMEDVKEKLLNFLLQHSQNVLTSSGCPIGKNLLREITLGGLEQSLPEETRDAFNKWYKEQTKAQVVPSGSPPQVGSELRPPMTHPDTTSAPGVMPGAPLAMRPENAMGLPTYCMSRPRMRTSFDPENEIPRLQKWFQENEHPSRDQMLVYLQELNALESRHDRKPLDLTNIVYWFKNARAAQRRANKTLDTSNDDVRSEDHSMEVDENENETLNEHLSPSTSPEPTTDAPTEPVPVLPNRNAVYVVKPLETRDSDEEVIRIRVEDMDEPEKPGTPLTAENNITGSLKPSDVNSRTSTPTPSNPDYAYSHKDENEQEEATDLSIRSRRDSSDSCTTVSSLQLSHSGSSYKLNSLKREREEDDDLSSSNAGTPSPPRNLPQMQQLQQHHALQMAAMSHAFNIQYMHPASVYSTPMVTAPFPSKDVKYPHPNHTPSPESDKIKTKRSRVFIDPLSEIPKMEKWFLEDTHPSSYMIEKYTDELNRSPYRQRFPKLEPKNVQLWFKNHRAKVKRARLEMANNNTESGQLSHTAITENYSQSAQKV